MKRDKAYYQKNRRRIVASNLAWNERNPEKMKAIARAYYLRHKSKLKRAAHAWAQDHPALVSSYKASYRAKPESKAKIQKYNRAYYRRVTKRKRGKLK